MDSRLSVGQSIANAARAVEAFHRRICIALLLGLCLFTYLPGLLRLPAVDRTEIIFADTTRAMVERGNWLDPSWRGTVHQFRPIGTFWAQGVMAKIAGAAHARDIRIYRVPGFLAVTLAVLAVFWLSAPLVGTNAATVAAGLFAVAPLTVLLSQLAIADGLALLPATVAMLALLRIYVAPNDETPPSLALLFWGAIGIGMLINALQTPILVAVTLAALYGFDRNLSWLKRLRVLTGLPLALALGAPWLIVRVLQDGVPFAGLGWHKLFAALGGAQDMKLRAFPGTFLLAALLGFLPGTALLAPALQRLWQHRSERLSRFLVSWIVGYILYLELISSKPGTYTVQVMFPALALAVAVLVATYEGATAPRGHAILWPPVAAAFGAFLLALPFMAMRELPPWWIVPLALVVAWLFFWSAKRGRAAALGDWAKAGIAALALFAVSLTAMALPSIDRIWPARQITRALDGCAAGPLAVAGFREPSAYFVLGSEESLLDADTLREALVSAKPAYVAADVRDEKARALGRMQYRHMKPIACVKAYDAMRGCPLYFTIQATGGAEGCKSLEAFPCTAEFQTNAQAAREKKGCE